MRISTLIRRIIPRITFIANWNSVWIRIVIIAHTIITQPMINAMRNDTLLVFCALPSDGNHIWWITTNALHQSAAGEARSNMIVIRVIEVIPNIYTIPIILEVACRQIAVVLGRVQILTFVAGKQISTVVAAIIANIDSTLDVGRKRRRAGSRHGFKGCGRDTATLHEVTPDENESSGDADGYCTRHDRPTFGIRRCCCCWLFLYNPRRRSSLLPFQTLIVGRGGRECRGFVHDASVVEESINHTSRCIIYFMVRSFVTTAPISVGASVGRNISRTVE